MSLRDKLEGKQEEVLQRRREEKQREDEAKYAPIRTSISVLQGKRQQLEGLLAQLGEGYGEASKALGGFKRRKQPLNELYTQYADVLKETAVETKSDFVKSDEFKDEPEIQEYKESGKTLREKAGAVRATKKQLKEEEPDLSFKGGLSTGERADRQAKPDREQAVETIKARMAQIDSEIQKLSEQTPEGMTAKLEEAKRRVVERHKEQHQFIDIARQDLKWVHLITTTDIEDSKHYGDDLVKKAIVDYYDGKVDKSVEKGQKKQGLDAAKQELDIIMNLDESFSQASRAVQVMKRKREIMVRKFTDKLTEEMKDEKNSELLKALRKYYGSQWAGGTASEIAERFLKNLSGATMLEYYDHGLGELGRGLENFVEESQKTVNDIRELTRSNRRGEMTPYLLSKIPNTERIMHHTEALGGVFDDIGKRIESDPISLTTEEFTSDLRNVGKNMPQGLESQNIVFRKKAELRTWDKEDEKNVEVVEDLLRTHSFKETHDLVEKKVAELRLEGRRRKEDFSKKIDVEWAEAQVSYFEHEHSDIHNIVAEGEKIDREHGEAEKALIALMAQKAYVSEYMQEEVQVVRGRIGDYAIRTGRTEEISQLGQEIAKLQLRIDEINKQIAEKDREAGKMFASRKKIRSEKEQLEQEHGEISSEMQKKQTQRQETSAIEQSLHALYKIVKIMYAGEDFIDQAVTVEALLDGVEKHFRNAQERKLPTDQQAMYDEYKSLRGAAKNLKEQYEKGK